MTVEEPTTEQGKWGANQFDSFVSRNYDLMEKLIFLLSLWQRLLLFLLLLVVTGEDWSSMKMKKNILTENVLNLRRR